MLNRRALLSMIMLAPLGACVTGPGYRVEDGFERLLTLSTQRAFARLFAPDGFYDAQIARIDLLPLPENPSSKIRQIIEAVMQTGAVRRRISMMLNRVAQDAARRAMPVITAAIRGMSRDEALAAFNAGPTAATDLLREHAGPAVIDAIIPGVSQGLRADALEILGAVGAAATGVDYVELGRALATQAMYGMFAAIGREEAAIRADPAATRDPVLIALIRPQR